MACNGKVCKIVGLVLRNLLGLICVVFGLNKFLGFMPTPNLTEPAMALMGALVEAGYFMPTVGIVFLAVGIALLAGIYVPLALVVLFPVSVNIFFFHAFLDPAGIGAAFVVTALNVLLLMKHKTDYKSLFKSKCCHQHGACDVKS